MRYGNARTEGSLVARPFELSRRRCETGGSNLCESRGPAPHTELLVDVLEVLSHGASLDYQDARDLGVRKAVGHPEHHLAFAASQSIGGVRVERLSCRAKPPSELGGAVQPGQIAGGADAP